MSHEHRPPGLGPHVVGQRVVVRRVLRGQTGPSGGPALTDLLGVAESWSSGVMTVRAASGEVTAIEIADIVSGKPVPPRPSVRQRVSAEEAELRAQAGWPPRVCRPLGEWLLRASGGYSARANSVLAVGDPGVSFEDAAEEVLAFYADHELPAWAQVVVGSAAHDAFESAGWVPARPGEADTEFQVGSVAQVSRAVRRSLPSVVPQVTMGTTLTPAWLAADGHPTTGLSAQAAAGVLEGPAEVAFAEIGLDGLDQPDGLVARGRVTYTDDWTGITNLWVSPDSRRQGLAVVVVRALLEWAAERGATTAYLQTRGDNLAALGLYERLGFRTHHTYRYLTPG